MLYGASKRKIQNLKRLETIKNDVRGQFDKEIYAHSLKDLKVFKKYYETVPTAEPTIPDTHSERRNTILVPEVKPRQS